MRAILIALSAAEEIALRKIHLGSSAISPDLVARLKELALIERAVGGWRLTPLGMRRYDELPDAPLRGRALSTIDDILGPDWAKGAVLLHRNVLANVLQNEAWFGPSLANAPAVTFRFVTSNVPVVAPLPRGPRKRRSPTIAARRPTSSCSASARPIWASVSSWA